MTRDELTARREQLQRILTAREGVPGYRQNVEAIKAELIRIEKQLGG